MLSWSLYDVLLPRTTITVVRLRTAAGATPTGAVAVQAAGWIEPAPFSRHIVPLTSGTVAEILVQESDPVKQGQVVARLVPDDAKLEWTKARASLALAEANREDASTQLAFAKEEFAAAIALTERVAVAEADLAGRRAESEALEQAARRTQAEVTIAEEELTVQRHLAESGVAGPRQVELAEARVESARASHAAAAAAAARSTADVGAAEARRTSAATENKLRITDRRTVALAETRLAIAKAEVAQAQAVVDQAGLRLSRVEIVSPWDGVVLERLTVPGATVGGQGLQHAAICSVYDPTQLRVRVDVPQASIGKLAVDQVASIRCESRPDEPYAGKVLRIVQRADIQKVTLQVHVQIEAPDDRIRPEMLCQVRFLALASTGTQPEGTALFLPTRLLVGQDRVWALDVTDQKARLRRIEVGDRDGEWIEVRSGLNATDKLIDEGRDGLAEGAAVVVRGGSRP